MCARCCVSARSSSASRLPAAGVASARASHESRPRPSAVGNTQEGMASRVTSSRLVGRDVELIELEDALQAAGDGAASLFLVGGDSGIGKTRLVSALLERAEPAGAVTMTGDCLELAEAELPYAPIVAALRP